MSSLLNMCDWALKIAALLHDPLFKPYCYKTHSKWASQHIREILTNLEENLQAYIRDRVKIDLEQVVAKHHDLITKLRIADWNSTSIERAIISLTGREEINEIRPVHPFSGLNLCFMDKVINPRVLPTSSEAQHLTIFSKIWETLLVCRLKECSKLKRMLEKKDKVDFHELLKSIYIGLWRFGYEMWLRIVGYLTYKISIKEIEKILKELSDKYSKSIIEVTENLRFPWFLPADTRIPTHGVWEHNEMTSALIPCITDDLMLHACLVLVDFGGIQAFIQQSRRTSDLWASSWLTTVLAWAGLKMICEELGPDVVIYPDLYNIPLVDAYIFNRLGYQKGLKEIKREYLIPAIPASALFIVPSDHVEDVVKGFEEKVKECWKQIANSIKKWIINILERANVKCAKERIDKIKYILEECWNRQTSFEQLPLIVNVAYAEFPKSSREIKSYIEEFLRRSKVNKDVTCTLKKLAELIGEKEYALQAAFPYAITFLEVGRELSKYKILRRFETFPEPAIITINGESYDITKRCTLCGDRNPVVPVDMWEDFREIIHGAVKMPLIDDEEHLCALCLIKRLLNASSVFREVCENCEVLKPLIPLLEKEVKLISPYPSTGDMAVAKFRYTVLSLAKNGSQEVKEKLKRYVERQVRLYLAFKHVLEEILELLKERATLDEIEKKLKKIVREPRKVEELSRLYIYRRGCQIPKIDRLASKLGEPWESWISIDGQYLHAVFTRDINRAMRIKPKVTKVREYKYREREEILRKIQKAICELYARFCEEKLHYNDPDYVMNDLVNEMSKLIRRKESVSTISAIEVGKLRKINVVNICSSSKAHSYTPSHMIIIPFKPHSYFSLVAIDGDFVGKWVAGLKLPKFKDSIHQSLRNKLSVNIKELRRPQSPASHKLFSRTLAHYALKLVKHVVEEEFCGRVVYAGGDDILALLPPEDSLLACLRLHEEYRCEWIVPARILDKYAMETFKLGAGYKVTNSAGLVIAHYMTYLGEAITRSRSLLEEAKEYEVKLNGHSWKKDAIAVEIISRGGGVEGESIIHWLKTYFEKLSDSVKIYTGLTFAGAIEWKGIRATFTLKDPIIELSNAFEGKRELKEIQHDGIESPLLDALLVALLTCDIGCRKYYYNGKLSKTHIALGSRAIYEALDVISKLTPKLPETTSLSLKRTYMYLHRRQPALMQKLLNLISLDLKRIFRRHFSVKGGFDEEREQIKYSVLSLLHKMVARWRKSGMLAEWILMLKVARHCVKNSLFVVGGK